MFNADVWSRDSKAQRIAVMRVIGLPKKLRHVVEKIMVEELLSPPLWALPGSDEFDIAPCTPWRRMADGTLETHQLVNGTAEELNRFYQRLNALVDSSHTCELTQPIQVELEHVEVRLASVDKLDKLLDCVDV
ncbi:Uncharacterised protein [Corynebacterium kutscheri]|uniref:Uncharacterized protein n=1 Tax=Corynebacterium kutscheri TaxID=35755 RepID=A0A0F6R0Y1_9CORY|nr:hypothetical protein [Corynebacterium kutscheri]AKE41982.1 hypothetical protein UL82_09210 [Corynebacterium kutscheri]VEH06226.1 Uncharacterised protein [Corynebacterium kutscheri]VEH10323.1 Uncharacterised protein [Corynebacterium kutscheri]VEH82142.1 Uncharacterised protein [Corynebacterium kutscheri]